MATTSKSLTSVNLATMSPAERLAFYREAAKHLSPAPSAKATANHVVVQANIAAANLVNAFADGRDAYRVTRATRGQ